MLDAPQGSQAWLQARLGKATASKIADVIAKAKNGTWYASREKYLGQLVVERLTGVPYPSYTNTAMEWGTATEPQARAEYAFVAEVDVLPAPFYDHLTIDMSGASPDGLVGDDGLVEIKCPESHTHINTLLGDPIDGKYITQVQWQLAVTGRQWCDWVSYDPRMRQEMRLFIKRIHRDREYIAELENEVRIFLIEVDKKLAALSAMYPRA